MAVPLARCLSIVPPVHDKHNNDRVRIQLDTRERRLCAAGLWIWVRNSIDGSAQYHGQIRVAHDRPANGESMGQQASVFALHRAHCRAIQGKKNTSKCIIICKCKYWKKLIALFQVCLYVAFVTIMVRIYTLPLFAFRPMYYTMRNFKKAFHDIIMSRRAISNMNTLYPDATPEELAAADNVCIICREEMVTASKKLPCNHIFHTACLRSWFQRQQTCPTCRLNILRTNTPNTNTPRPQNQAAPAAPAQPGPQGANNQAPGIQHGKYY